VQILLHRHGLGWRMFPAMITIDKERASQITRNLVDGVTADIASIKMIVDLNLLILIQLLID
jgi:hypothetical protein